MCRCGSAEGLDAGRHCLKKWGFRRCEDICWIKSNAQAAHKVAARQDAFAVLQHTKVCMPLRWVYPQSLSSSLSPESWIDYQPEEVGLQAG